MIEIIKPTITKEVDANGTYGKFVIEPLERNYATTLGNCMRRVLLSSLPGAAITSVKIDGILHEFSTIPGVKEDVTEIILNLKRLAVKLDSDEDSRAIINAVGPKEVTAADIIVDAHTEIFNPDLHIATLAENATLVMEMNIATGKGYVPAEQNKNAETPIAVIPVDSIYTPVQKVNFIVSNTRVGNVTDYDKLTLEVETNGVVVVRDAVSMASDILVKHFGMLRKSEDCEPSFNFKQKEEDAIIKILETGIEELELSVRSFNCLKRAGINTDEDLTKMTEAEMWRIRNLGKKSFDEITEILHNLGLSYKDED